MVRSIILVSIFFIFGCGATAESPSNGKRPTTARSSQVAASKDSSAVTAVELSWLSVDLFQPGNTSLSRILITDSGAITMDTAYFPLASPPSSGRVVGRLSQKEVDLLFTRINGVLRTVVTDTSFPAAYGNRESIHSTMLLTFYRELSHGGRQNHLTFPALQEHIFFSMMEPDSISPALSDGINVCADIVTVAKIKFSFSCSVTSGIEDYIAR